MIEPDLSEQLRHSVVKLFTVVKESNYYAPWERAYQQTSGGSACIVEGNRILTNAHVVANQLYVQALKPGDAKKYAARVLHVDHDRETALLTVDDPQFFVGTVPVTFGELPARNAKVTVYGFPVGGNELCITAGVVSRIEVRTYTHSQRNLLALQTDAAINPGNSGGPVFMNGELVGLAFQSYKKKDLEKSGYVVPITVVRSFFADLEDGAIGGVPDLGVYWQKIENPALRAYLGVAGTATGVRVSRVLFGSSADSVLRIDDVLVAIDGTPIGGDGTIALRANDRVHFEHLIGSRQVGDVLAIDLVRRGEPQRVSVTLRPYTSMVPPPRPERRPSYLIFAGLVFTTLSYEYMHNWEWAKDHHRYRTFASETFPSMERRQIVLIHEVLAHEINVGYHQVRGAIVERVNGRAIRDIHDVVAALDAPVGEFHVIETDYHGPRRDSSDYHTSYGTRIVLDRATAERATGEILQQHSISAARSADLA
ncbi:MAG: trypsin-like peptidase domain-containing protein [Proteobacteria bacterium]|nr:trypsin-like peptidase domain-containing protein [Pseudomonadota bacterium]